MTRFLALISCLILMLGLCVGVSAADTTRAYNVNILASVSSDGSCDVTSSITLHVAEPLQELVYPVPAVASNVTLNGSPVITEKTDTARLVDLSKTLGGMAGDFSFTISYSIHSAVDPLAIDEKEEDEDTQKTEPVKKYLLELPMLSGFAYPIDELQFSVNLPGAVTQSPSFISGYHQEDIEKDLTFSHSGGNIAGRSWNALKDHETLVMYLEATEDMFPQTRAELPDVQGVTTMIGLCVLLALLYWLLFLRNWLPLQTYPAVAPEGFGAGQLGTVLTMAGTDLNLMIFSWAQLGYVLLRVDRRNRILVIKRMDMGNERTAFERKCFSLLFSRRDTVDTSSMSFQRLCQTVSVQRTAQQLFLGRHTGRVKIFRFLIAAAGLLCGTSFGILLGNMLDFGWLFMLVLSLAGLLCSWHIQLWPQGVFLHHRSRILVASVVSVLWLAIGVAIGQFGLALLAVLIQVVGGFLASFGGRRTEIGRMAMGQTLRLRRHLKKLTVKQVQQLCRDNPEFFFDMAPYAMALGCDAAFSRRFGKSKLPVCPYIQASDTRSLTAKQWNQLMRGILDSMVARQRKLPLEAFRAVMDNYMK